MAAALVATVGLSAINAPAAFATANTSCNINQTDNTWIVRTQGSDVVSSAGAYISYFDYNLCNASPLPPLWPIQSSSGAWAGIINGSGSNIIQVGYIKCNSSQIAGCKNFPVQDDNITVAFWAWGVNGDPFHQPWPHFLATVTNAYHYFRVFLVNRGSCYYAMSMDQGASGYIYATVPCDSIPWTPNAAQIGNEVWNSGDQLGGWSGTPQHYFGETFTDQNGQETFTNLPQKSGHCYPQADFSSSSGQGDEWRSWTYVTNHNPC
jgi:hypothetical protein